MSNLMIGERQRVDHKIGQSRDDGFGKLTLLQKPRTVFVGHFKDGEKHGRGSLYDPADQTWYASEYENGRDVNYKHLLNLPGQRKILPWD